jgi:hypothetical protein
LTVLLPSDTHRKCITSITSVLFYLWPIYWLSLVHISRDLKEHLKYGSIVVNWFVINTKNAELKLKYCSININSVVLVSYAGPRTETMLLFSSIHEIFIKNITHLVWPI